MEFERHSYYLKAGRGFIVAVSGAYILTIPFTTPTMLGGQAHNHLLILLEVLGCLYLFYSFKARDINFNYSFIAERAGGYYLRVLKKIGRLWLWLLPMFALSATYELVLHRSWAGALTILMAYVSSALGLSGWYFFVSLVEKLSYDSPQQGRPVLGARIAMLACIGGELAAGVLQCAYAYIVTDLGAVQNAGATLARVSLMKDQMTYVCAVLLGIAICQVLPQLRRGTRLYAICRVDMLLTALSAVLTTLWPLVSGAFSEQLLHIYANDVQPILGVVCFLAKLVLWILTVHAMTHDARLPRALWTIPGVQLVAQLAGWFFESQSMLRAEVYCEVAVGLGCAIFLTVALWRCRSFEGAEG